MDKDIELSKIHEFSLTESTSDKEHKMQQVYEYRGQGDMNDVTVTDNSFQSKANHQ